MLFVLICRLQDITDYLKVPTHDIVDVFAMFCDILNRLSADPPLQLQMNARYTHTRRPRDAA